MPSTLEQRAAWLAVALELVTPDVVTRHDALNLVRGGAPTTDPVPDAPSLAECERRMMGQTGCTPAVARAYVAQAVRRRRAENATGRKA